MENLLLKTVTKVKTSITLAAFAIAASYLLVYKLLAKQLTSNQLLIAVFSAIFLFAVLVIVVSWIEYLKSRGSSARVDGSKKVNVKQKGKSKAGISDSEDVTIFQE